MPPEPEIIVSEEELLALVRGGARITALPDEEPAPPPGPTDVEQIVTAIKGLAGAIASRSVPDVKVGAPAVTVRPNIVMPESEKRPLHWRVTNLVRDNTAERLLAGFDLVAVEDDE